MKEKMKFILSVNVILHGLHLVGSVYLCGKTFHSEKQGVFSTPNYHTPVAERVSCTYTIKVPGHWIELSWLAFDVDGTMPDCENNYVAVFIGCGSNEVELSKFCNRNAANPHQIFAKDGCIKIEYQESTYGKKGFQVKYISYLMSKATSIGECVPNHKSKSESGVIINPDWPARYSASYCGWTVQAGSNYKIKLNVMDIDLYDCSESSHDQLIITSEASGTKGKNFRKVFCSRGPFSISLPYPNAEFELVGSGTYRRFYSGFAVGYMSYVDLKTHKNQGSNWRAITAGVIVSVAVVVGFCFLFCCWYERRNICCWYERRNRYSYL